jgi:hypothetical protein
MVAWRRWSVQRTALEILSEVDRILAEREREFDALSRVVCAAADRALEDFDIEVLREDISKWGGREGHS